MRYDTGNPVEPNGSYDPRDLFDNSANIDLAANGAALSWVDRKGNTRKSMAGMEADFQTALINLGYIYVGPYAAGLTLTLPNQIFDRGGEYWRVKPGIALPLVMTGIWATDQTKVVGIGDATLRAELSTTTGGTKVGYKARNVNERLADQRSGKDDGAKGDGSTNDTVALNTAIANALPKEPLLLPSGLYLVDGRPTNPNGIQLEGPGAVVSGVTGGLRQWNTYAHHHKIAIGREHMGRVYSVLKNTTRGINAFAFGDSTVEGGFTYLSWPFFLQSMLPEMAQCQGIQQPFNVTNRGVGGTKVSDMNAIPDVSATTDLFIIKYGINDGTNPLATRLATFRDQLRAKLTQIRQQAYGGVSNLAILLVGPNSTYDTPGQRDAYWYEQLRGIYVQAAEEFQCGFFDTYAYLQDSSAGAATGWLDDTVSPGSGRGVHPTDIGNPWIWGAVMDWLLGGQQLYGRRTNNFVNNGGTFASPLPAKTPQEYRKGITMERARLADGWPEDGAVVTTMQADGIGEQRLFPFENNRTKVYVRNCYTSGNYWNRWTGARENLVYANSWTAYGAPYSTPGAVLSSDGTVTLTGSIKGGTATAGVTFATLPAGMRPVLQEEFVVCTSSGTARIIIYPDGSMQGLSALDATRTSLGGVTFPAA